MMTTSAEQLPQATRALQWLAAQLPSLLSALLILVAGLIVLALARRATPRLVHLTRLDVLAERIGLPQRLYELGLHGGVTPLITRLVTLIGQLILLHMLAAQLGLHALSRLVLSLLDKLPALLASGAIMAAGLLAADLLRRLLTRSGAQDALLPTGVYYLTLVICAAMALEQLGLNVSLIHTLILIIAAAGALVLAIAAIVSGRQTSRNLAARRYAATILRVGDRIRTPGASGAVAAFHELHLALSAPDAPDAQLLIPYHELLSQPLTIYNEPPAC